jgi:hypothetical protein
MVYRGIIILLTYCLLLLPTAVLTKKVTPIKIDITETTVSTSAEPMDM